MLLFKSLAHTVLQTYTAGGLYEQAAICGKREDTLGGHRAKAIGILKPDLHHNPIAGRRLQSSSPW